MLEPPSGTVTLLFTDIQGSTRLLQQLGDAYPRLLLEHRGILRAAFRKHGGYEVETEGDAFFVVFERAEDALAAACAGQCALLQHRWATEQPVLVRMGLHTGEPIRAEGGYVGLDVHLAARLCAAGWGGQILLSASTAAATQGRLPDGVTLEDLSEHRLKDIRQPVRLFQVVGPGLASNFPPLRTLAPRQTNLPADRDRLIGREEDAAVVRHLLLSRDTRIATLTGTGGTGKTRLALHVARQVVDHFDHGVFLVELGPVTDPGLVMSTIARTLGVRESARSTTFEDLVDYLHPKHCLLVLDNFEQVVAAGPSVSELLGRCPHLSVLVTSRTPLHITGEHELPVSPLGVPDDPALSDLEKLAASPAVMLFVERARAAKPDFRLTSQNARPVVDICVLLDGLPLALELAAARIRLLPPAALLERLRAAALGWLTGGPRDAPARHQTLRAAIAWSFDLLEPAQRVFFRRLAVFVGGFSIQAATAVGALDGDAAVDPHILDQLEALLDRSLIRSLDDGARDPRFGMLETIREFALGILDASDEASVVREQHAWFFLELAEHCDQGLRGRDQADSLRLLEHEYENVRAALAWWTADGGRPELALRLATALGLFWYMRNQLKEGRAWLESALANAPMGAPALRAKALVSAGALARLHNDLGHAADLLTSGSTLLEELGDFEGVAWAASHLGMVLQFQGEDERALAVLGKSVELYRAVGDTWGLSRALTNLGCALNAQRKHARAIEPLEAGVALQRSADNAWGIARGLPFLAKAYSGVGDYERASALYEEGLRLSRQFGDDYAVAEALQGMANIASLSGDRARSAALLRECLAVRRGWGGAIPIAAALQALAAVTASGGSAEHATRLFAAGEALLQATGATLSTAGRAAYQRDIADLKAALGAVRFAAAWSAGAGLSLDKAIDEALAGPDSPRTLDFIKINQADTQTLRLAERAAHAGH